MKLKRGQKLCNKCNKINGARAYVCKHCNTEFDIRGKSKIKKPRKLKRLTPIDDWKSLEAGDRVKVIGRSGNYYINEDGDRQYLTDRGTYIVQSKDETGLVVYNGAYGYIYMGEEVQSTTIPNMYRSPHKIFKVNTPIKI